MLLIFLLRYYAIVNINNYRNDCQNIAICITYKLEHLLCFVNCTKYD